MRETSVYCLSEEESLYPTLPMMHGKSDVFMSSSEIGQVLRVLTFLLSHLHFIHLPDTPT